MKYKVVVWSLNPKDGSLKDEIISYQSDNTPDRIMLSLSYLMDTLPNDCGYDIEVKAMPPPLFDEVAS